jgi:hypothetical protein
MSGVIPQSTHAKKLAWFRNYFRPHFVEWVFNPIDRLVPSQDALIGFIVMTCAIDYLAGFWWGITTKNKVQDAYEGFINEYFPPKQYDASGLYDSLRNGLVHMFTIKDKKYAFTHNQPHLHLKTAKAGHIMLNAKNFRDDLVFAREKYLDEVEANPELLDKLVSRYFREGFLDVGSLELKS